MARQHGSRATRSPSATHFGEEAVRNLERGHTGTRLPKAVRLVSPRARQHTACRRPTDPLGGASEQARRTDNDDVHRPSSGGRTTSSAPSATTQRPQLRLPAAGVGAQRGRRPPRGSTERGTPWQAARTEREARQTQQRSRAAPRGEAEQASASREGGWNPRHRHYQPSGFGRLGPGFGLELVDEGCCGAPQASAAPPTPGSAAKVGEGRTSVRCRRRCRDEARCTETCRGAQWVHSSDVMAHGETRMSTARLGRPLLRERARATHLGDEGP